MFIRLLEFIISLGPYVPFIVAAFAIRSMIQRGRRKAQRQEAQEVQYVRESEEEVPWIQTIKRDETYPNVETEEHSEEMEYAQQPMNIYTDALTGAQYFEETEPSFEDLEESEESNEETSEYTFGTEAEDEATDKVEQETTITSAFTESTQAISADAPDAVENFVASIQKLSPLGQAIVWKEVIDRPLCDRNYR